MKYKLVFLILILIYSCSSISKKNKSDYFVSKVNVNKDINGQLSILKCSKDPKNEYIIKFNKSKDSLIFNSSVNICDLLKEHLLDGGYIISDISFRVNSVEQKLKYNRYQFGVIDTDKKMLYKKSGGGLYCFIKNLEAFKKTLHYGLSDAEFQIVSSTISLDSISSINMLNKLIGE